MLEPCKRFFYTVMANYNGSLRAVDCYSHSVRYDMVLECSWQMPKKDLIRSPTSIVTNEHGPLKAVDCYSHSGRFDMMLEWCSLPSQIGPHQVIYEAVAWLIHI
eukprot:scaffold17727_cov153-Skeletonema_dohrnii-CCMP3373.AAC.1